jgi:site-specific recombinase XerD
LRRVEPCHGKNIWRLCKTNGRRVGAPELKPHDLLHGVAMGMLEQHRDVEHVRALLGHTRVDITQIYATIRPAQLTRAVSLAVSLYEEDKAVGLLSG